MRWILGSEISCSCEYSKASPWRRLRIGWQSHVARRPDAGPSHSTGLARSGSRLGVSDPLYLTVIIRYTSLSESDWRKVWDLFDSAAELCPEERSAWLDANTSGDIRRKVVDLLGAIESVTPGDSENCVYRPPSPAQLGRFEIIELLGRGGMGEVYRAFDPALGRDVAIKCIAPGRIGSAGAVSSMIQEARAASVLNHPGIVTIYEVLRSAESVAIVMECIRGHSLRAMPEAHQPLDRILAIGKGVAESLAAAHQHGIIHRDIKPENVMVRSDGIVKIVDFGLATNLATVVDEPAAGTFRYMSPEQVLGHTLTPASDVFSLGVVLYELASGVHPFGLADGAKSTLAVVEAIASTRAEPVSAVRADLPRSFDLLLSRMLARDPGDRPSAAQVVAELESIGRRVATAGRRRGAFAACLVVGVLAGVWAWRSLDQPSAPPQFQASALTTFAGSETQPAWSPDGSTIAFVWTGPDGSNKDIYIKELGTGRVGRLTTDAAQDFNPAFSPDGKRIAFLRQTSRTSSPQVITVPAAGGAEQALGRIAPTLGFHGLAWWPDGQSLLLRDVQGPEIGLVRLFLTDGRKVPFVPAGSGETHLLPTVSGRFLAFARSNGARREICVLSQDPSAMRCFSAPRVNGIAWLPGANALLFSSPDGLWHLQVRGRHAGHLAKAADGAYSELAGDPGGTRLAFSRTLTDVNIWRMNRDGTAAAKFIASSGEDSEPVWSPDGKRVLIRSDRSGNFELYSYAADGTDEIQLTRFGAHLGSARWSPDGRFIAFDGSASENTSSVRHTNVYLVPASGGPVRRLTDDNRPYIVPAWSADGRYVFCQSGSPGKTYRVSTETGRIEEFHSQPLFDMAESADGRFHYYTYREQASGIYRRRTSGGPEWLVPRTDVVGLYRYWSIGPGGIYFVDGPPDPNVRFWDERTGQTRRLASFSPQLVRGPRGLSVSPDGTKILFAAEDLTASDIMVLTPR